MWGLSSDARCPLQAHMYVMMGVAVYMGSHTLSVCVGLSSELSLEHCVR